MILYNSRLFDLIGIALAIFGSTDGIIAFYNLLNTEMLPN